MGKESEKTPKTPKTFLAVGPTLHYSHRNVQFYWLLAAFVFSLACLFWSRIVTGGFWAFDFESQTIPDFGELGRVTISGVSIFEYPWQILVLGLLMGIMAVVPVLVAQLMSFGHSFIFVLAVFFLANLPGFAVFLMVSCFAVASRPLRFRSRIVAIALCMAPQLIYWGVFGAAKGAEPLGWGYSLPPWIWAWLTGMTIAGLVLGIGHYTRYKPGLIWIFATTTLLLALLLFDWKIGFDELDYQLYVAQNNPGEVPEFRDHSIREALDDTITDPTEKEYRSEFFPTERIPLREDMKKEIQTYLARDDRLAREDRWPSWLVVPDELRYQEKREELNRQYDRFISPPKGRWMPEVIHRRIIERRSGSRRMPIALYYKGLLNEYSPDPRQIHQDEILHFYGDYPYELSLRIWFSLYSRFPRSLESAEARWRLAYRLAGKRELEKARTLLGEAWEMIQQQLERHETSPSAPDDSLFSAFRAPADTAMTLGELRDLQGRIYGLQTLIGDENLMGPEGALDRLATLVTLNPHSLDYERHLDTLLSQTGEQDGLRDNLLLEKATLIADDHGRAKRLAELTRKFQDTDGGMQALYELTRLNIRLYQQESKTENLVLARKMLNSFLSLYPDSFYAVQVRRNLDDLPRAEIGIHDRARTGPCPRIAVFGLTFTSALLLWSMTSGPRSRRGRRKVTDRQGNFSMAGGSLGLGPRVIVVGDPCSEFVRTMVRLAREHEVEAVPCDDAYSAVAEIGGLADRRALIVGTMRELTRENGRFFELAATDAIRCCCFLDTRTAAGRDGVLSASRAGAAVISDPREAEDVLTEWLADDGRRPRRLAPQDLLDNDLRATEAELSALLGHKTNA